MTEPVKRSTRVFVLTGGVILIGLGALGTHDLFGHPAERFLPTRFQYLMFLGPVSIGFGIVTTLRGLFLSASRVLRRVVLGTGLLMLAVGGCPWMYTPFITGDRQEGAGMLATMIFIFVGMPGLAITIAGWALRQKAKSDG